jgi:hypothetical protein
MKTLMQKKQITDVVEQGKVISINRVTGRVSVSLRNGLIVSATYIYDIKDLFVGNSVIVTKVSNAYVILNKVSGNVPIGNSFSLSTPAFRMEDHFLGNELNSRYWRNHYNPIVNNSHVYVRGPYSSEYILLSNFTLSGNFTIVIKENTPVRNY